MAAALRRTVTVSGFFRPVSWSTGRFLRSAASPFVYHPQTRVLEPEIQALYLTKATRMEDIWSCVEGDKLDDTLRAEFMSRFRKNIIQARLFNYEGERSTRQTCALPLMQNMLKEVWSHVDR